MSKLRHLVLLPCACLCFAACSTVRAAPDPDVADVTLPAPAEAVRTALIDVLTSDGYEVDEEDAETLTTGVREEIDGPWDWLLRWRFGVGKSRVEAKVTPLESNNTRVYLHVFHRSKDGIFDAWQDGESPLPQSAANQVRLLKNRLHLL